MGRINVEDTIYRDERFINLCQKTASIETAIGALVRAWDLAQRWYKSPNQKIPKPEWEKLKYAALLIECDFAYETEDGLIYVRGTNSNFKWLMDRTAAGRRGGLKKQENLSSKPKQTVAILPSPSPSPSPSASSSKNTYSETSAPPPEKKFHRLIKIWNENRGPLAEVIKSNTARDRKILARWKESPSDDYWVGIVRKIAATPRCLGENNINWKADFDWLLKPETHLKVSEWQSPVDDKKAMREKLKKFEQEMENDRLSQQRGN